MFAKHLSTLLLLFYLIVYKNNGKFLMLCEKFDYYYLLHILFSFIYKYCLYKPNIIYGLTELNKYKTSRINIKGN